MFHISRIRLFIVLRGSGLRRLSFFACVNPDGPMRGSLFVENAPVARDSVIAGNFSEGSALHFFLCFTEF